MTVVVQRCECYSVLQPSSSSCFLPTYATKRNLIAMASSLKPNSNGPNSNFSSSLCLTARLQTLSTPRVMRSRRSFHAHFPQSLPNDIKRHVCKGCVHVRLGAWPWFTLSHNHNTGDFGAMSLGSAAPRSGQAQEAKHLPPMG